MTLIQLAERVEKLTGPHRGLDALIGDALGLARRRHGPYNVAEKYTASLDAAMSLVPEGWRWMAGHREHPHARAYVENGKPSFSGIYLSPAPRRNPERRWFEVVAATPALALCAAALRARAAMEPRT